jgi:hypothetical protein
MTRRALPLALCLLLLAPASAQAAGGADYLRTRLGDSGGFREAGSRTPSVSLTQWSVMGLKAAGKYPATWHNRGGHTPLFFLAHRARGWNDAYQIERGILAAVAMGRSPYSFGGRNLVAALRSRIRFQSGRIGPYANSTYWGVLALRAARSPMPVSSLAYIRGTQWANGGFGYARGGAPDSNDTAAALMALRSGGTPCSWKVMKRGYDYLHSLQRPDGGYALTAASASDSQSTSWAVQARRKCGHSNGAALDYLGARQLPSGAFNYQPGRSLTPAWVTAQVLPATNGRSYPIVP